MTAEPPREVSEVIDSPGEGEAEEKGREVAELNQVNGCHVCTSVSNNDSLVEVDKCKKGETNCDVADTSQDNKPHQAGEQGGEGDYLCQPFGELGQLASGCEGDGGRVFCFQLVSSYLLQHNLSCSLCSCQKDPDNVGLAAQDRKGPCKGRQEGSV